MQKFGGIELSCKGVCTRYKAKKPVGIGRYASGQQRCQECEIFVNWNGDRCPCCNTLLRGKPRALKYKALYEASDKQSYGENLKNVIW